MEPRKDGLSLVRIAVVGYNRLDEAFLGDWTHQLAAGSDRGSVRIPLLIASERRAFGNCAGGHIGWCGEDEFSEAEGNASRHQAT